MGGSVCRAQNDAASLMLTPRLSVVFNTAMDKLHPDAALIDAHGGPAEVARKLCLNGFGTQRVFHWRTRGIPAQVKLAHPDLFLPGWKAPRKSKQ